MSNIYYVDYIGVDGSSNTKTFGSFDEAEEFSEKIDNLDYTLYTHTDQNIPRIIKKHKAEILKYTISFDRNGKKDIRHFCKYHKCVSFGRSLGNRNWSIYSQGHFTALVKYKKRLDF